MQKFSTINAKYCRGLSIFDKDNHFATCKSYIGWDPLKSHAETTFRHYLVKMKYDALYGTNTMIMHHKKDFRLPQLLHFERRKKTSIFTVFVKWVFQHEMGPYFQLRHRSQKQVDFLQLGIKN